jgi:hypothetical protein
MPYYYCCNGNWSAKQSWLRRRKFLAKEDLTTANLLPRIYDLAITNS